MQQAGYRVVDVSDYGVLEICTRSTCRFDCRLNAVDQGVQVRRTKHPLFAKRLERRVNRAAIAVAQHDHQLRAEFHGRVFDTADLSRSYDVSCHADNEQIAEALVENHLHGYPGVGAGEDDREWILTPDQFRTFLVADRQVDGAFLIDEATVAFSQAFDGISSGNHLQTLPPMKENWSTRREMALLPGELHVAVGCRQRGKIA